ncbi:hypothetical protein [Crossiella cryophila]|uniref:Uncharacterized protein n=1 Tax=Crossiella cryophila TaxID=43355 RepID=A0A7W7CCC8_9PSEU|nr:hypothetical protein [Crossiella cryophila]MBB4677311.1 hypothetical protein [Crossiella cryophila]
MLTPELLTTIADEADRLGLRIAGHLADFVPVDAALVRRQKSYEHMFGFLFGTSREEAEYRRTGPEAAGAGWVAVADVAGDTHGDLAQGDLRRGRADEVTAAVLPAVLGGWGGPVGAGDAGADRAAAGVL